MHAVDVIETLPTARPEDAVLSALRLVCQHGLPGLVVADEHGDVVGCMSSVDLVQLALPRYLRDQPIIARVFNEEHADHIAAALVDTRLRDVLGEMADRVPVVRPDATVVELAELMARRSCPIALIRQEHKTLGIVTANRLLTALLAALPDSAENQP
jgi:CBS-domain-containing membrane protein